MDTSKWPCLYFSLLAAIKFPFHLKQKLARNKNTKGSKAGDKVDEGGGGLDNILLERDHWRV